METKLGGFNEQFKRLWENSPGIVWGVVITVFVDIGLIVMTTQVSEYILPRLLGQIVGFAVALFVLQRIFCWLLQKTGHNKDTGWIALIIAALVYLSVFSFFNFATTASVPPPASATSAQDLLNLATSKSSATSQSTTQNSDWQEFTAPNGLFTILFPVLPTHTKKYSGTASIPVSGEMYRTEGADLQYFVEYVDYSKMDTSNPDSVLNMMANGIGSQPGNTLVNSNLGYWGNYCKVLVCRRMIDFLISTKDGHILARAIMDGSMLYSMGVIGNTPNFPQSDYEKFIYSFQLPVTPGDTTNPQYVPPNS